MPLAEIRSRPRGSPCRSGELFMVGALTRTVGSQYCLKLVLEIIGRGSKWLTCFSAICATKPCYQLKGG